MREVMTYLLTNNLVEAEKEILRLKDALKEAEARSEALRRQAEQWAMEARAHKSSLHEAYQAVTGATGEPGNWNGAVPIIAAIGALRARAEKAEAALEEAVGALNDALAGWRYIRCHHGDLYGVGWDRVQEAAERAIANARLSTPPPGGEHPQQSGKEEGAARADLSRASSSPQPLSAGWQDISTHDGHAAAIVVRVGRGHWYGPAIAFVDVAGIWRVASSPGGDAQLMFVPTHWMPLPPPPAESCPSGAQRSELKPQAPDAPKSKSNEAEQ